MEEDRKRLVAAGYDKLVNRYLGWTAGAEVRRRYHTRLIDLVPRGGTVLDLGCGAGVPVVQELSAKAEVLGIDISARQVEFAKKNVPSASFIQGDMMTLELPADHFDAVSAFFSITHLPREEHPALLARIRTWLRGGGIFLASMGATSCKDVVQPDWLGTPMFFSHFDATTNLDLVRAAGLQLRDQEIVSHEEDGKSVQFLWIVAEKPLSVAG